MKYYQPVMSEQEMIQNDFYSFQVYLQKKNAVKDFPKFEIKEYEFNDIENPTFVDVPMSFDGDGNEGGVNYIKALLWSYLGDDLDDQYGEIGEDLIKFFTKSL